MADPYSILGLLPTCSTEELSKRYKILALRYHPDKCKEEGAADKFKLISSSYQEIMEYKYDFDLPVSYKDMILGANKLLNLTTYKWVVGEEVITPQMCGCFGDENCGKCHKETKLILPEGAVRSKVKITMQFEVPSKSWPNRFVAQNSVVARLKPIQSPTLYHRGSSLFLNLSLHLYSALLGYDEMLNIAGEEHHIYFPHPIRNGDRISRQGEGMYYEEGKRGNLVVIFIVKYPASLSEEEESLIRNLVSLVNKCPNSLPLNEK